MSKFISENMTLQEYLDQYAVSHRNPVNKLLHWLCIPLIIVSLLGMLWSIPPLPVQAPELLPGFSVLNWALLFMIPVMMYYFSLSVRIMAGALVIGSLFLLGAWCIHLIAPGKEWQLSLAVFILAWAGQFIGHSIEGAKPSFFDDLRFFLIGPLWLLSFIYRKIGLRY